MFKIQKKKRISIRLIVVVLEHNLYPNHGDVNLILLHLVVVVD